jgi:hypothetical protein
LRASRAAGVRLQMIGWSAMSVSTHSLTPCSAAHAPPPISSTVERFLGLPRRRPRANNARDRSSTTAGPRPSTIDPPSTSRLKKPGSHGIRLSVARCRLASAGEPHGGE